MNLNVIFFGTGKFGAEMLRVLFNSKFKPKLIISQPDRPQGRNHEKIISPVKEFATINNIQILQPDNLKNFTEDLSGFDLAVVCEYGLIIPKNVLFAPKYKSINIHPSLLPKYRGPSPIQSTLVNGETETGVSIMLMDEKMDHGPILSQERIPLTESDDFNSLSEKLKLVAKKLLPETIDKFVKNELTATPQDDSLATFCKLFTREDGKIDWKKSSKDIYNLYRGLILWPGIWTEFGGKRLKLFSVSPCDTPAKPGLISIDGERLSIGCGSGSLLVGELQLEGKKRLNALEFTRGIPKIVGTIL